MFKDRRRIKESRRNRLDRWKDRGRLDEMIAK